LGIIMKLKRFIAIGLVSTLGWNVQAWAEEVVVSAASSLTNAFTELAVQFQQVHPGAKVLLSFAASDVLMQQIVNGAPTDVFASADQKAMNKAVDAKVIDTTTRKDFVRNEVVLVVPADNRLKINSLADLQTADVKRIAFGNPAT